MPPLNKHGADHVTAPFTFKGHFSSQTSSIVRVGLTGRGVVTAWLTRADFEGFPPTWRIDRLVYKFKHCGATPCPSLEP
jgi:hypothetical protein